MKHAHIINNNDLDWTTTGHGDKFSVGRKQLGAASGGRQLGCSMLRLEPGKRAWPFHYHTANEEAIYILEGQGTMRLGEEEIGVTQGDYITMLASPKLPHQLVNSSDAPLTYLCISTMISPDVVGYPDSDKMGLAIGRAPGEITDNPSRFAFFPSEAEVDYWQGE